VYEGESGEVPSEGDGRGSGILEGEGGSEPERDGEPDREGVRVRRGDKAGEARREGVCGERGAEPRSTSLKPKAKPVGSAYGDRGFGERTGGGERCPFEFEPSAGSLGEGNDSETRDNDVSAASTPLPSDSRRDGLGEPGYAGQRAHHKDLPSLPLTSCQIRYPDPFSFRHSRSMRDDSSYLAVQL
jgi:hypothetical protein